MNSQQPNPNTVQDQEDFPALPSATLNELQDINTLTPEGICNRCKKDAQSEQLKCISCKKRYHVIECTAPKICTSTFLEATWPNLQKNYPCIVFMCDFCQENDKLKDENIMMDRVGKMERDINKIMQIVTQKPHTVAANVAPTYAKVVNKPTPIIIKPGDGEGGDVPITDDNIEQIREFAVERSVELVSAYKNKQGHQVFMCQNEKSKEVLLPQITCTFPTKKLVTPPPHRPTITIKDIHGEYDISKLLDTVKQQNTRVEITPEDFKIIFIKEGYETPGIYSAVVCVSDTVRDQIKANRDTMYIGLHSCKVRDRFFVRRCNRCQGLGHFHGQCKSEFPFCAKCAGAHDTSTCNRTTYKCHNCTGEDKPDTSHPAYSSKCPVYIAAQEKMKGKISYYQKN